MAESNNLNTPQHWDAASEGYATHVAPFLMEGFVAEFIDRLDVDPTTEAVEVAAGSGALTESLARRVKSLLATDFSPGMVSILRQRLQSCGLDNVSVDVMDGQALMLADASFDRAACNFGLMLFPDRARGFAELRRVLRPGGRALVSGWAGPDRFDGFRLFLRALQAAFPDLPPPPAPMPVFSLASLNDFRTEMEVAGFEEVEVDYVTRELVFDNIDGLWAIMTSGAPPVKALFERVGPDGADRIRAALTDIVDNEYGGGPIATLNTATVGCGVAR